jgi:23S rRNA pseudouridine2605 synthase
MAEFSKDGRKLRPRRSVSAQQGKPAYSTTDKFEPAGHSGRSFGGHDGHRHSSGPDRESRFNRAGSNYSESRGTSGRYGGGEGRPYGERRPYGGNRQGEGRPYGQRNGASGKYGDKQGKGFTGRKPAYGAKPYAKRGGNSFNKAANEGINRMIAASPKASATGYETYSDTIKEEIRLNKFIANSGVCSRREADTMIQAGVVTVNGEVVTELGTKVNVLKDVVKFNGETLRGEAKVYIVMNKPKGYVTTASDPHADKTVMDLLKACPNRVYPVGRLDKATTGVLMFTNDGEISERLTHPSYDKKKIYQVVLNKPLPEEDRQKILSGIELSDGPVAADALEFIDPEDKRKLGIEIHSGKNRVVRRLFEAVGCEVRTLDRVYFAGLTKKGLKKGEWRYLTEGEVNILKMGAYV